MTYLSDVLVYCLQGFFTVGKHAITGLDHHLQFEMEQSSILLVQQNE